MIKLQMNYKWAINQNAYRQIKFKKEHQNKMIPTTTQFSNGD